jgi:N-methylhydantoinase A
MIDIRTIGAGGSSVAWIDNGGMLRVGPQSAGARPGPACYGHGGQEATVTDANVVLGRIDPANFLGGRMVLDRDAAYRAIARPAEALGRSVEEVAMAIVRIANNNMVGARRSVLIERGIHPRECTLWASGAHSHFHAKTRMNTAKIPRTIIPTIPPALGLRLHLAMRASTGTARRSSPASASRPPARATSSRGWCAKACRS